MWTPQGLPLWSGLEEVRAERPAALRPHLEVAHDAVRLWRVQPARRGHGKPLCPADEKIAGGWVATALRAAVAKLRFLSAHSDSEHGCGRGRRSGGEVGWGTRSRRRARAKGTSRGRETVGLDESRMHRTDTQWRGECGEGRDVERSRIKHTRSQVCPAAKGIASTLTCPGHKRQMCKPTTSM